ncbi:MAG: hypothetical protein KatS3mg087_1476 [Patescibacteria group bacterium]|nr:MAG: hypothetical protein KatS3mg087_1476 [Patescibacteria group bacterium]
MPMLIRYVEIRAFYTPEDAKKHEKTPSTELIKSKEEAGFEGVYRVYSLDEAIKKMELLLFGERLSVNFVLWEINGPIYTSNTSEVRKFFLT